LVPPFAHTIKSFEWASRVIGLAVQSTYHLLRELTTADYVVHSSGHSESLADYSLRTKQVKVVRTIFNGKTSDLIVFPHSPALRPLVTTSVPEEHVLVVGGSSVNSVPVNVQSSEA
jgi:hypothetical protein